METNYPALANLANIQCENCHGPGSQHMDTFGKTNMIAISYASGDCAQCHDAPPNQSNVAEWNNSMHAITTRDPAGNASCVGCHTAYGFIAQDAGQRTDQHGVTCRLTARPAMIRTAKRSRHQAPNPYLIRSLAARNAHGRHRRHQRRRRASVHAMPSCPSKCGDLRYDLPYEANIWSA